MTSILCQPPETLGSGEEIDRSFRELCELSEEDSEDPVTSLSPKEIARAESSRSPTTDFSMNSHTPSADTVAAERFITQQLSVVPPDFELRNSTARLGLGVWTKHSYSKGKRFGPFIGKFNSHVKDPNYAWEVSYSPIFLSFQIFFKFICCFDNYYLYIEN
ncbi:UNVERIFIED_CONTAM: hypothetical protein RMT77_010615 [Armadillidium vulgare]